MIVDGRTLAEEILREIGNLSQIFSRPPILGIITCAPNFETEKYLGMKRLRAERVGIDTELIEVEMTITTEELIVEIQELAKRVNGIVLQLPLPPTIRLDEVLRAIPPSHDVDALNPLTTKVLSPVMGAIAAIIAKHAIPLVESHVTIIGSGRLVGLPAGRWFTEEGASVSMVTKDTVDVPYYTRNADIIVCGAGVPGLLTPDMIKVGVAIFDAGTSEDGGVLRGDADLACAEKASLFTPVPGGIGPMTVAVLLRNVVQLTKIQSGRY